MQGDKNLSEDQDTHHKRKTHPLRDNRRPSHRGRGFCRGGHRSWEGRGQGGPSRCSCHCQNNRPHWNRDRNMGWPQQKNRVNWNCGCRGRNNREPGYRAGAWDDKGSCTAPWKCGCSFRASRDHLDKGRMERSQWAPWNRQCYHHRGNREHGHGHGHGHMNRGGRRECASCECSCGHRGHGERGNRGREEEEEEEEWVPRECGCECRSEVKREGRGSAQGQTWWQEKNSRWEIWHR